RVPTGQLGGYGRATPLLPRPSVGQPRGSMHSTPICGRVRRVKSRRARRLRLRLQFLQVAKCWTRGLTPELSRAAKRRRLERIVRPPRCLTTVRPDGPTPEPNTTTTGRRWAVSATIEADSQERVAWNL